ncbi:hypothetical protein TWF506_006980 [Arthrobotrys conoides]|uniref:Uncharacterized protein n=1 Tax=Arthrobotrys conoides TaxID=74498 RepID=A0AAN8P4P4_9PEZI
MVSQFKRLLTTVGDPNGKACFVFSPVVATAVRRGTEIHNTTTKSTQHPLMMARVEATLAGTDHQMDKMVTDDAGTRKLPSSKKKKKNETLPNGSI